MKPADALRDDPVAREKIPWLLVAKPRDKTPELTLTVPVFCRAAPPILLVPVPVVCACSTPRFSSTLPVPVELPTEAFVMLNVPLVSLTSREALVICVLVSVALP